MEEQLRAHSEKSLKGQFPGWQQPQRAMSLPNPESWFRESRGTTRLTLQRRSRGEPLTAFHQVPGEWSPQFSLNSKQQESGTRVALYTSNQSV